MQFDLVEIDHLGVGGDFREEDVLLLLYEVAYFGDEVGKDSLLRHDLLVELAGELLLPFGVDFLLDECDPGGLEGEVVGAGLVLIPGDLVAEKQLAEDVVESVLGLELLACGWRRKKEDV